MSLQQVYVYTTMFMFWFSEIIYLYNFWNFILLFGLDFERLNSCIAEDSYDWWSIFNNPWSYSRDCVISICVLLLLFFVTFKL